MWQRVSRIRRLHAKNLFAFIGHFGDFRLLWLHATRDPNRQLRFVRMQIKRTQTLGPAFTKESIRRPAVCLCVCAENEANKKPSHIMITCSVFRHYSIPGRGFCFWLFRENSIDALYSRCDNDDEGAATIDGSRSSDAGPLL